MKKIKEMFRSAQSRYGSYSALLIVIVIAVVIMINLAAGQLPDSWKNIDLSSNDLYEITSQSKELLGSLDKKVEIHVLADKSATDERIKIFVEKYAGLSKNVSLKWTDPALHPTVLTENDAENYTIIVSCEETGKSTQISFADIIQIDQYAYYYEGSYKETGFDAEGQLTSAVNYVVNDVAQKIYYTAGHGESAISEDITDLMKKSNYTLEEINTLMVTEIPKDCDLLFMHGPVKDISEEEKTMISTYMQEGGDVILVLGMQAKETANLNSLLSEYGLQMVDGVVADVQRNNGQNPFYLFPVLSVSGDLANGLDSQMVMMIQPKGMKVVDPVRDTITVEEIMTTSDYGYAVTEGEGETTNQVEGKYVLGAIATENESKFTVITSETLINENITAVSNLENKTLFMNLVSNNFEHVSNYAIEVKDLSIAQNTMQYVGISSLIFILGVPIAILVYGFVRWMKRRKA